MNATEVALAQRSWFPVRVAKKFANAIMEQSEHADSPNQRSSSMISYCLSPFAAICMTTAIFLNRIMVFASSSFIARERTKLPLISRVVLRLIALYLLYSGSYGVIVAFKLKFDESSNPLMNYILSSSYFDYNYEIFKEESFLGLPYISRSFLDYNPSNSSIDLLQKSPSPSVLKPLYLSLCLGQILETFIAATNGDDPLVENGLTLFEYSLAFQEVQSAEVPSYELLVIALVAVANQVIIHLLGLFDAIKIRLIPSSLVGSFVLSFYFYTMISGRMYSLPFIVVLGYLPQLLTFFIILLCISIFLLAAIFKGSFKDLEFSKITDNLNSINILMTDDFYTALTNLGTFMITAAGKSSYVKEISHINIATRTWLENTQIQRKKSFIQKLTGYNNKVEISPELQELRDRSSNARNSGEGKWIFLKRGIFLKALLLNFKEVLVSFFITNKIPNFLRTQEFGDEPFSLNQEHFDMTLSSDDEEDEDFSVEAEEDSDFSDVESYEELEIDITETDSNLGSNQSTALAELIASPEDLLALVTTEQAQLQQSTTSSGSGTSSGGSDVSPADLRILRAHLLKKDYNIITRSKFNSSILEPSNKLLDLLIEKRSKHEHEHGDGDDDDDDDDTGLPDCVICQTNQREIILWPCKCLAICESCRVSLIVRGFNDCVCCRRKVEAYSKVFTP